MQPTLRIDSLAGEAVTEFPSHNAMQIRAVKQQLQEVTGLPRFRQRLLRDHTVLGDDELVTSEDSPLQLVQMDFHEPSPEQPLLKDAVVNGWEEEVERLLCRPVHPDGSTVENTRMPQNLPGAWKRPPYIWRALMAMPTLHCGWNMRPLNCFAPYSDAPLRAPCSVRFGATL